MWIAVGSLALQAATCAGAPASPLARPTPLSAADLEAPVLALRVVDDGLLALSPRSLALYRREGATLRLAARLVLPVDGPPARRPGGLLRSEPGSRSVWALATGWSRARLVDLDAGLGVRAEADALPWPGAADGVRLRPGTDLIEARLAALGDGPFLALADDGSAALDASARFRPATDAAPLPVGPPFASAGHGLAVTGSRSLPGEPDALLLVELIGAPRIRARCPIEGALRALAVAPDREAVVMAVEEPAPDTAPPRWRLWESRLAVRP